MYITYDPIGFSNDLQNAGMPKAQADVIARAQQAGLEKLIETRELATRRDLAETEARLRLELSHAKNDMIKWVVGVAFAQAAFLVAVMAWMK